MNKLLSTLSSTFQGGARGGLLFLALLATTALWAYDFQSGDLYYNITSSSEPYTVEVTYQQEWSHDNYATLTSATIPETVTHDGTTYTVTSIGDAAFFRCSSLTSITIPNSVTSIREMAFVDCSSLTSITIPNSVTSIGAAAFQECSSLTAITIPNSVTSIGRDAFAYCSSLTSVTIGNSVTSIGNGAFDHCSSLTSITIPNSVTSIGEGAFVGCSSLESIVVESGNTQYDSRENCNAIIETTTNTLIAGCKNTTIPNSVTSIGYKAFFGCSSLIAITIPNSVTSIEDFAFNSCSSLTAVTIGNSVTSIGEMAFYGCSSLTAITIPNSVTSIGDWAFGWCSSLTSVTIGNSVTSIGSSAFRYCSSLTSVTCLATTLPMLGDNYVFYGGYGATLLVPCEALADYQAHEQWGRFTNIECIASVEVETEEGDYNILYTNKDDAELYRETLTFHVPVAPTIAGFTFVGWQASGMLADGIVLQAVYTINVPTSAPEEVVNPTNPAQKLIRNGHVYILRDGKTYNVQGAVMR